MLGSWSAIIICSILIERGDDFGNLLHRVRHNVVEVWLLAFGFRRALLARLLETGDEAISAQRRRRAQQSFAEQPAGVSGADGRDGLDPSVGLRRANGT